MKIGVVPRYFIEKKLTEDQTFAQQFNFISIYSNHDVSPLPDRDNILRLQFDDVTETDLHEADHDRWIFFNEAHANKIAQFALEKYKENPDKEWLIHCDAGVSRSGAVGYVLNEYFNKYLDNKEDAEYFLINNRFIQPNSLVCRLLKPAFFGETDYSMVFNDYRYNSEGEKIFHDIKV